VLVLASGAPLPPLSAMLVGQLAAFAGIWMMAAMVFTAYGVTHLEAGRAAILLVFELLAAVISAMWIAGERLTGVEWIGAALIVAPRCWKPAQTPIARKNRMKETSMNRLTWVEYKAACARNAHRVPAGGRARAARAAPAAGYRRPTRRGGGPRRRGEAAGLVAPALAYGYKSQPKCGGGQHFPGTTSLDAQTLAHTVRDCIREFARHGVEKLVIVNAITRTSVPDRRHRPGDARAGGKAPLTIMRMEYWTSSRRPRSPKCFRRLPGYALEHAAVIETSMMLHYHPQLVRLERIPSDPPADFPPYDIYPTRTEWVPPSGVLSSAKAATPEKGKRCGRSLGANRARRAQGACVIERPMPAIAPVKTALLVIDMQRDFLQPDGYAAKAGLDIAPLRAAIGPVSAVLAAARAAGLSIVHTREGHLPDLSIARPTSSSQPPGRRRDRSKGPLGRLLVRGEYGHISWTSCARCPTKS